jgi:CRP-like cAMP-binding protein
MIDKKDFLAGIPLFSKMENQDLGRLAERTREVRFPRKAVIIKEGDVDGCLFMIASGTVEVVKNWGEDSEQWIRALGPYEYFGEMALLDDMVRSASVIAVEETTTLVLDRLDLNEEIRQYPSIALELLRMLSRRVQANEKRLIQAVGAFLPICVKCSKVCEDTANWKSLDEYIEDHTEAALSNTICPACSRR